jgi:OpgC protein
MPSEAVSSKRDPRIDVLRGMALLMIFVDHIPGNVLSLVTLHNFGFSDAAEVFVLLNAALRDLARRSHFWLQHKENDHVYQDHTGFRIGDRRHLRRTGICRKFFCAVQPYAGLLTFLLGDQPC